MKEIILDIKQQIENSPEVGVFASAGFDSTVMLYTICKVIQDHDLDKSVDIFLVKRSISSVDHMTRIVEWLQGLFPVVRLKITVCGNTDLPHELHVLSGIIEILSLKRKDLCLFLADTSVPQDLQDQHAPQRMRSSINSIKQPFFDYEKTTTIQLAEHLDILDDVSKLTHSCTQNPYVRCGECWQCKERSWAFKKLGLIDLGKM